MKSPSAKPPLTGGDSTHTGAEALLHVPARPGQSGTHSDRAASAHRVTHYAVDRSSACPH
ncbi:MAG: hypothetical protein EOP32_30495 [Rhodococcus sp. (in: high G+C Gram-positive bacteria)]|nr:MAG: hypothetical protein EOP32_30495 [Rhodococcus sp. (in: high G+C Gram-positive bacteria)]